MSLKFLFFIFFIFTLSAMSQTLKTNRHIVPIIFDTDIAGDYDDVGAMALVHAFADNGEAKILATISSNAFYTTAPTLSVLNDYFGRPELPIGITKNRNPEKNCPQEWAQAIIAKYPHKIYSNKQAREAVDLYREVLAREPDNSITVITVGFFTNLADLISSPPDRYSPLSGKELVKKKVKLLVSMAIELAAGKKDGKEYNVYTDIPASQKVFQEWNTPFVLSPFEVGAEILTGIPLIGDTSIQNSPVKDAYAIALQKDRNSSGRRSWDQTAVLAAVRGIKPYFSMKKINVKITSDGRNVIIPGNRFICLGFNRKPEEVQAIIEQLMHHKPKKKEKFSSCL